MRESPDESKWKESSERWKSEYLSVVAEKDILEEKLNKIYEASKGVGRGCDCNYDYRCGNCSSLISLIRLISPSPLAGG